MSLLPQKQCGFLENTLSASSSSSAANFVRTDLGFLGVAEEEAGTAASEGCGSPTGAILLRLLAGACISRGLQAQVQILAECSVVSLIVAAMSQPALLIRLPMKNRRKGTVCYGRAAILNWALLEFLGMRIESEDYYPTIDLMLIR